MTAVLRRFNDPTRWAGIPIKVWLGGGAIAVLVVGLLMLLKPPLLLAAAVTTYLVFLPVGLLGLWSFATGVPVLVIVSDFLRFVLRRQALRVHEPHTHLRGGVFVTERPTLAHDSSGAWSSAVDLDGLGDQPTTTRETTR